MPRSNFCKSNPTGEDKFNNTQNTYLDIEDNLKNKDFIQLYDKPNTYLLQLIETDKTASRIFLFMARWAEYNNTIDVSVDELAEIFNLSERTIRSAIKTLEEYNFLTKIKIWKRNIYFLNPTIVYNNKAQFKQKMYKTYRQYTETTEIKMQPNNDIINMDALKEFKNREKITYKFKLKNTEFDDTTIEEILTDLEQKELMNKEIKEMQEEKELLKLQIEQQKKELSALQENREPTFLDFLVPFDDFTENEQF